jgi:lipopolysaccharide assembly outer membrane protein LptD (OstA)
MVNAVRDTSFIATNSISMRGRLKLTKNWNINIGNIGYDFNSKSLTYPDIGFYRDLHCWEAGMDWQPQRGTYNFYIRVKPGTLDFLKLPYRKNNADAVRGF